MNLIPLYTMPSLETITKYCVTTENDISTEGFNLKDLIKKVKDLILRIKEFIKNVFRKAIAGFKAIFSKLLGTHKQIEEIVEVVEPDDLIAVVKKVLVGDLGRTKFILNRDTSIIDVDAFHKFADDLWEKITDADTVEEIEEMNTGPSDRNLNYTVSKGGLYFEDSMIIVTEKDIKALLGYRQIKKLSVDISEKGYPKQINEIEEVSNNLLRKSDLTRDEADLVGLQMAAIFVLLKCKLAVSHSLLGLYRGIYTELRKGSVFNTPVPQNLKLVHVSKNGELDETLIPRQPSSLGNYKSHYYQILPKRVSFAPTIKEAVYGIPLEAGRAPEFNDKVNVLDLFVYEPIIEKDTMMIKEKYMKTSVSEWKYTHEVAITTPIKVKKKALVRVYFDKNKMEDIVSVFGGTSKDWINVIRNMQILEKY